MRSAPTCSAGTVSTPSSRGSSATAYSTCVPTSPFTTSTRRVLVCPLTSKSASSADQSGVPASAWSVSTFRVAVSPSWMRSRSSQARVAAPAGNSTSASSTNSSSRAAVVGLGCQDPCIGSVCPLPAAAFVLEAEPRTQQPAGIVRDPPQPGIGGFPAFVFLDRSSVDGLCRGVLLRGPVQRALHLFAKGLVGLALRLGVGGFVGRVLPARAPVRAVAAGFFRWLLVVGWVAGVGFRRLAALVRPGLPALATAASVVVRGLLVTAAPRIGWRALQRLLHDRPVGHGVFHAGLQR